MTPEECQGMGIFSGMDYDQVAAILEYGQEESFGGGKTIFQQEDANDGKFYLVADGSIESKDLTSGDAAAIHGEAIHIRVVLDAVIEVGRSGKVQAGEVHRISSGERSAGARHRRAAVAGRCVGRPTMNNDGRGWPGQPEKGGGHERVDHDDSARAHR